MMQVKMLCTRCGEFGRLPIHKVVDLPEDVARDLIDEGAAAPVYGARPIAATDEAANSHDSETTDNEEVSFEDIGIVGKTAALLREAGLKSIADVEAVDDLTPMKGIGKATAETVRAAIRAFRQS